MSAPGYNPMRWNCREQGKCYNETLRPRIEEFAECFPRRIGMSDVDAIVEVGGRVLMIEWKALGGRVTDGQMRMFKCLTAMNMDPLKFVVLVVRAHPRTLETESVQTISAGQARQPEKCTFDELKGRVRAWAERAERAKTRPSRRIAAE